MLLNPHTHLQLDLGALLCKISPLHCTDFQKKCTALKEMHFQNVIHTSSNSFESVENKLYIYYDIAVIFMSISNRFYTTTRQL